MGEQGIVFGLFVKTIIETVAVCFIPNLHKSRPFARKSTDYIFFPNWIRELKKHF